MAHDGPRDDSPVTAPGAVLAPYAAYLRVYQPLEAFDEEWRSRFRAGTAGQHALDRAAGPARERAAVLSAITAGTMVPDEDGGELTNAAGPDAVYALRTGGTVHVCPVMLRARCWAALATFRQGVADPIAEAFVPRHVLDEGTREAARSRFQGSSAPTILTNAWHVPLRWFIVVDPGERVLVLAPGARALRFVAPMVQARRRLARALAVLRRTVDDAGTVAGVEELGRWLEEWHPRSLVELDYGGLVTLMDDATLRDDRTPEDLAEAVLALGDGDGDRALAAYGRATDRWHKWVALESAS